MNRILLFTLVITFTAVVQAQVVPPTTTRKSVINPAKNNQISPSTKQLQLNNAGIEGFIQSHSLLHFAGQVITDPDCKGPQCFYWQYTTSVATNGSFVNTQSFNWKQNLLWRKIPQGAMYGKYEVALSPFTNNNNEIVLSGIIPTHNKDSVLFEINYDDATNKLKVVKRDAVPATPVVTRPAKNNMGAVINNSTFLKNIDNITADRKYFVRITPLDAAKNQLPKTSNEVIFTQEWDKVWVQNESKNEPTIYSDYTITAVKYVPVHFPNSNFYGCTVITGYKEGEWGEAPGKDFINTFKNAFPVGKTICPSYDSDDKPFYKKAFNGVTGFIIKAVDGAAAFYNDTKNYVKNKMSAAVCSAAPAATKDKCQSVAGYAFDGAMVAAGIPPSLPNTDDLTKMAEGQIVDLTCDKLEQETGLPVPEVLRNEIRKEFHDNIFASSLNRMVDCGFFRVKPHPEGFFQTAYLEIEITRTGNSFKNKVIAGIGVNNKAERSNIFCENCNGNDKNNTKLSYNLFEKTFASIPFLPELGNKTKIILVLKPQESWIHYNSGTGKIKWIEKAPSYNEFYTPVPPTYEGAAQSPGFNMLYNQSIIKFDFGGFKIANNVQLSFTHQ